MTPSKDVFNLAKQSEGLRLTPYQDVAGHWTIGWGHKMLTNEPHEPITEEHAEGLLIADLSFMGQVVSRLVKVPITQGQYDALCDFCFNLGPERLATSTLLADLNAGKYNEVPDQLSLWVIAGGKTMQGLVKRRQAEIEMWTGTYEG